MLEHDALSAHGRRVLAAARELALEIHADEVGPEHLLFALMADEEGAAHRAVVHAFADPETIGAETLALAAGILVSGSVASLPFSPGGVRALEGARELAAERGDGAVREGHLAVAAVRALPPERALEVEGAGFRPEAALEAAGGEAAERGPVARTGPLFRAFTEDAKRALSAALQVARQDSAPRIAPAHLLQACLSRSSELARAAGLSAGRARACLRGHTHDASPPAPRPIEADTELERLLSELAPGAGSVALLAAFHAGGTPELATLLARHRVTPALLERLTAELADPDP